jgi:hypothetical protein
MPRSNTSRPSDIALARSPPRKYHWVWAAWMTPPAAAANIVGTIEDAPETYRVAQDKSKGGFRVVLEP